MKDISIFNIFGKAWELFKENLSDLITITFFYLILVAIIYAIDPSNDKVDSAFDLILSIICGIAQMILTLGFYKSMLDTVDGNKPRIETLFNNRKPTLILHYILGSIIIGVGVLAGLIFFIIPGIFLAIRLQFYTYLLLEQEECDCMKALSTSWAMTEGHVINLFTLGLLSFFIVIAGVIAFLIGIFAAIPISIIMLALAYRILSFEMQGKLPLNP